ncbi:MAG: hypothetical protein JWM10_211, partial [Myxococcaceae bacterium]|nr:hypothetical protein [Myxococcaceae bacterium]
MRRTLMIVAWATWMSGCGGDTTGTGDGVTVAAGCGALADALCNRYQTCTSGLTVTSIYGDVATCVRRVTLGCTSGAGLGGSALTGAALQRCATSSAALTCDQLFEGVTPAGCEVPGTLAAGAPCAVDIQCQSRYCARPAG